MRIGTDFTQVLIDRDIGVATGIGQTAADAHVRPSLTTAVFLHCGWRTRGTWIWSRYRAMPGVCALYEPLSDVLASLRPETVGNFTAGSWESGHDGLDQPYFAEFRPLLRNGTSGVAQYRRDFATHRFFVPPDAAMPELQQYLRLLLDTARQSGDQPVLKFARSAGRIGWMQRHFPQAAHIVVVRNPLLQFDSVRRQLLLYGNAYFLAMPLLLLALHRDLPAVRRCTRSLGVELPAAVRCLPVRVGLALCESVLRHSGPDTWYRIFLAFWTLSAAAVPASIGLVIDSDRLVGSSRYRQECQARLADLTGRTVHFGVLQGRGQAIGGERYWPHCADMLAAHRAAEAFLAAPSGTGPDRGLRYGWTCRMLAEASLRALGAGDVRYGLPHRFDAVPDSEATLAAVTRRAIRAEEALAVVVASRSWRWTAPLRWSLSRLRGAARAVHRIGLVLQHRAIPVIAARRVATQ